MKFSNSLMSQALYEEVLTHQSQEKKIIHNFLNKLRRSKKMKQLPNILRKVNQLENEGIVKIISAFEISPQNMKNIEALARQKFHLIDSPIFIYEIDETMISGFKIITNYQELDLSLDNSLTKLKENLWQKI